jgi:hypothetical protein
MKKILIGAVVGGALAYWGHRKTLKAIEAVKATSTKFSADMTDEPAERRASMHVVK